MLPETQQPNTQGVTPSASAAASVTPPTTPPPVPAEPVEEFDRERAMATIKAQREEAKKLKAELKDYERLKADEQKRLDEQLSEAEKLGKRAEKLEAKNAELTLELLRRDVIAETGLPAVFADRLKGNTKEEMLADAEELKKVIPAEKPKAPHLNSTNPNAASTQETEAQRRERIFGRQSNIFDLNAIQAGGGGVVFTQPMEK